MNRDSAAKIHSEFLVLVERLYNGESLELAMSALPNQYRWANVGKIVLFCKQNEVGKDDWSVALSKQAAEIFSR